MFDFYVYTRQIKVEKTDLLVSDSVNVYPCRFRFSKDWEGLNKTVCFRAGKQAVELVLGAENQCNIPYEVLLKHKQHLFVGVYGMRGEDLILNTIWTDLGEIYEGAKNIDVHPEEPTPDVYQQLLTSIGNLEELETEAKDSLVDAINEVNQKIGTGCVGPDGPAPAGVSSFNGRSGKVVPQAGDYTAEMVGADVQGSAEAVRKELDDYKTEQIVELNKKLDKSGGIVSGAFEFTNSDTNGTRNTQGNVKISAEGITGVIGNENDKFSVPNMGQLQFGIESVRDEIPLNTSELINDSGFATEQFVQDKLDEFESGGSQTPGVVYEAGAGIDIKGNQISVQLPTVYLTKEEYDALSEEDKNKNVMYAVEDEEGPSDNITMQDVNQAIQDAIVGAIQEAY